jgi:hypothetical protein
VAAGFDKLAAAAPGGHLESRLSRLLEEPIRIDEPATGPSILEDDDEDDVFRPSTEPVSFDAEEDLDIPDFLKS